jgi:mono/diheme cytochrome c family protein
MVWLVLSGGAALCSSLSGPDQSTTASGFNLYHSLSCHGCHSINGQGEKEGPNLVGVGNRLSRQELEVKLTEPLHRQSYSRMPSFAFVRPQELQDLANFLQSLK